MLNNKKFDSGEFGIYLIELPVTPFGMNPFTIGLNYHQDGIQNTIPKDPELDEFKIGSRRTKGFNYTSFGPKLSVFDTQFSMTYEDGVKTADIRHISDDSLGNTNITNISPVTAGNTAFLNQRHGIQHAQVATGALLDESLRHTRRAIFILFSEIGDEWERIPNKSIF